MSFRVGDKVRIRTDLREGNEYHKIEPIIPDMIQYAGIEATITRDMKDETYELDCDKGEWHWPEKALIPVVWTIIKNGRKEDE